MNWISTFRDLRNMGLDRRNNAPREVNRSESSSFLSFRAHYHFKCRPWTARLEPFFPPSLRQFYFEVYNLWAVKSRLKIVRTVFVRVDVKFFLAGFPFLKATKVKMSRKPHRLGSPRCRWLFVCNEKACNRGVCVCLKTPSVQHL